MLLTKIISMALFVGAILLSSIVFATVSSPSKNDFKPLFIIYLKYITKVTAILVSVVFIINAYAS